MNRQLAVLVLLLAAACASSGARPSPETAVQAFVTAMENADADQMAAAFAEDATLFMPFDSVPARIEGREEIRRVFARFFENVRKPGATAPYMQLHPVDLAVQSLGDTAIITFHLGDKAPSEASSFSRRTFVVRWSGDRWVIAHLHASNMRLAGK